MYTIDTETFLVEPGNMAPTLVSLGWKDESRNTEILGGWTAEAARVAPRLVSGESTLAGHNVSYDLAVMCEQWPDLLTNVFEMFRTAKVIDTMVCDKMFHIARGWSRYSPKEGRVPRFGLADLSKRYLQRELGGKRGDDVWRLRYSELYRVPVSDWPKEAYDYAAADVGVTEEIAILFRDRVIDYPTSALQHYSAWCLHLMSVWGVITDSEAVDELERRLRTSVHKLDERLKKEGLIRANGTKDMEKFKERVANAYESVGKRVPRTKGKAVKTDAEALELAATVDPALKAMQKRSKAEKLISTFIPVLCRGRDSSINCRYNVLVDSGRTSCSDPNLQQLPRKGGVRECFVPREGCVYIGADFDVAELCSLAEVCLKVLGFSELANTLNEGKDPHIRTAASVLGMSYDEAYSKYLSDDEKLTNARQVAKILNFGLPGGLSTAGLQRYAKGMGVTLSYTEASRLRELWFSTYPEMKLYFAWISSQCGQGKFKSKHPVTGYVRGDVGFTDGANHMFQHLTATGAKQAIVEVAYECYVDDSSPLYGCRPVLFVHDELLLESAPWMDEGERGAAGDRLSEVMVRAMSTWLTKVRCGASPYMMRRLYKGAKTVRNSRGVLIPWEPPRERAV